MFKVMHVLKYFVGSIANKSELILNKQKNKIILGNRVNLCPAVLFALL